jgi:hypothetical protein
MGDWVGQFAYSYLQLIFPQNKYIPYLHSEISELREKGCKRVIDLGAVESSVIVPLNKDRKHVVQVLYVCVFLFRKIF